jgi:hypothetical protein
VAAGSRFVHAIKQGARDFFQVHGFGFHEIGKSSGLSNVKSRLARSPLLPLSLFLPLSLVGCGGGAGSFDEVKSSNISFTPKLASLLGIKKEPEVNAAAGSAAHLTCPQILVLDGMAAHRVYTGSEQTNAAVRYQFSIDDVARECTLQGDKIAIKVGVEGKVLLGPAGSSGNFNVPVKISVIRESDDEPLVTKFYRADVSLASGQSEGSFTIVSDVMQVPFTQDHAELDYSLRVGVDEKGAAPPAPRKGKRH